MLSEHFDKKLVFDLSALLIDPMNVRQWPMKLPEMDPVSGNKIFLNKKLCAFVTCLGQFKKH